MNEVNNVICTLTGAVYRAAFAVVPKDDVRYYLNGIHINAENGDLVATDGSIMYVVNLGEANTETDIIFKPVKILAGVESVEASWHEKPENGNPGSIQLTTFDRKGSQSIHICECIDGRFPDYKAVWDSTLKEDKSQFNTFSFATEYLAVLLKIFGKKPVTFEMTGPDRAARVSTGDESAGELLLMPCKA